MNIPEDLYYTETHEWIKQDGDLFVTGISDFAQHMLTDIVFVELPEVGTKVERGEMMMVVESVKSVSDIFAPITGTIEEVNNLAADEPATVNDDPYGKGWFVKIKAEFPEQATEGLSAADYGKICEGEGNG